MNYDVIATEPFERKVKRLSKKYKSLSMDLAPVFEELTTNPTLGTSIGKNCYKIRVAISSKGKGKSGGARIITFVRVIKNTVYLIDIFDKSEQANISEPELKKLLNLFSEGL